MICPVCKHRMIVVEYHDIELDYCNNCKGVWFDSGELELLLKSYGVEEPKAFFDGIFNSQEAPSEEKKRKCPICGHRMKKTAIGGRPGIIIDVCRENHGLWFDGGEAAQLLQRLAKEQTPKRDSGEHVMSFLGEVFGASQ
jgi:Zn-finger nucleic acid-binding protein